MINYRFVLIDLMIHIIGNVARSKTFNLSVVNSVNSSRLYELGTYSISQGSDTLPTPSGDTGL